MRTAEPQRGSAASGAEGQGGEAAPQEERVGVDAGTHVDCAVVVPEVLGLPQEELQLRQRAAGDAARRQGGLPRPRLRLHRAECMMRPCPGSCIRRVVDGSTIVPSTGRGYGPFRRCLDQEVSCPGVYEYGAPDVMQGTGGCA